MNSSKFATSRKVGNSANGLSLVRWMQLVEKLDMLTAGIEESQELKSDEKHTALTYLQHCESILMSARPKAK